MKTVSTTPSSSVPRQLKTTTNVCFTVTTVVAELLDFLNEHTINQFSEDRKVICVFHNFKGYDGMFIQEELTKQKCVIENIITN